MPAILSDSLMQLLQGFTYLMLICSMIFCVVVAISTILDVAYAKKKKIPLTTLYTKIEESRRGRR